MKNRGADLKIKVNEFNVSYNDYGPDNAPVVFFIHGFPFDKSMWDKQVEALQDHYRVISYDIRGHGKSDSGKEDFSIELFVSDLIGLMDALSIEKAVLCGLSLGGYIALCAIETHPDRFEALILSDTQCIADTPEAKQKRMTAIKNIKEYGVEQYADESLKNLFAPSSVQTKSTEIAAVRKMITKTSKNTLCNTLQALSIRKETCSKLPDIVVPVLIMVGKEDKITPPTAARLMHERIQGSTLCILEDASHLSNMENPQKFNFQLNKFMHQFADRPFQLSYTNSY